MRNTRARLWVLAASLLVCGIPMDAPGAAAATAAAAASDAPPGCVDTSVTTTVEERRLDLAAPREILRRGGFDRAAPAFVRALCRARTLTAARRAVDRHGAALWSAAVDRAQGRGRPGGDLDRADDRPLYWARLAMTRALRQWQPGFPLADDGRAGLINRLERSSRGQDTISFPAREGVSRILVTGFDPFTLDRDIRISNPSGAAALALDGTVIRTASGPARIEAAMFPVRWRDFAEGTVERTLLPHFSGGPRTVDLFVTISQGRPERFDVERWNGAWRGGFGDNENASSTGTVPIPDWVPSPDPQPQWTVTSLPYGAITGADTGRFPVLDNTAVTEIPAGQSTPVVRPDGPTPGSRARSGGGGDYLSNEIAYRATLLRDALGLDVPGGHLHTPVLRFAEGNTEEITDPVFVGNRHDITEQVGAILRAAAGTLGNRTR